MDKIIEAAHVVHSQPQEKGDKHERKLGIESCQGGKLKLTQGNSRIKGNQKTEQVTADKNGLFNSIE